ncbi:ABC transporter ATP-binding protein [Gorillibacterium timonense]|uniref:ABC transporter ATP-binding protein n=1 Tax=Gorillibacterium timonense TaxID=1689269 RepID=UPI00071CD82A|nr:ABC transporter ATP-binding protein [Gorillibacterium timonense]
MTTCVLKATNLTKQYGTSYALDNVSLSIHAGEIYGLIGENGAGKTTLMRIIGNLARPNRGSLALFGETEPHQLNERRKRIGFMIETPALYAEMSARNNLEFYRRLYQLTDTTAIDRALREVNLEETGGKKVGDFSLGMRQRLALAVALLHDPAFLVLDEPINGLDPSGIADVRELLTRLAKEKRVAILISSHFLSELQLLATRFGFIHKGRMLREMTSDELTLSDERYICIRTSQPAEAAKLLQDKFLVSVIVREDTGELRVPADPVSIEQAMATLLHHGIPIDHVAVTSPSLETYYRNLIKEERG